MRAKAPCQLSSELQIKWRQVGQGEAAMVGDPLCIHRIQKEFSAIAGLAAEAAGQTKIWNHRALARL
jgi:hypothetical protein